MRQAICRLLVCCALTLSAVPALAGAADPFAGTWVLDLGKSTFKPGPAPYKSQTRVIASLPEGMQMTVDGVLADGSKIKAGGTYRLDGRDYPFAGADGIDSISLAKRTDLVQSGAAKLKGEQVGRLSLAVSEDHRTLTLQFKGMDAKEQPFDHTLVFNRK